jgi:hypothetical protein
MSQMFKKFSPESGHKAKVESFTAHFQLRFRKCTKHSINMACFNLTSVTIYKVYLSMLTEYRDHTYQAYYANERNKHLSVRPSANFIELKNHCHKTAVHICYSTLAPSSLALWNEQTN